MIQVTLAAYREIVRLSQRARLSSPKLQIGSVVGGCLGQVYTLAFRDLKFGDFESVSSDSTQGSKATLLDCLLIESTERTRPLPVDELQLSAHSDFLPQIKSLVLDYSEDLMGGNFRFVNPSLDQTCSCGQSFAVSSETA